MTPCSVVVDEEGSNMDLRNVYHNTTWRYNPEELDPNLYRRENPKSRNSITEFV
jgi:hypothetical protein